MHTKTSGILLRKDIHSVFDAGYATIDESYRFVVSEKIKDIFKNGNEYRKLHGLTMKLPTAVMDRPDKLALRWHNQNCFQG